MKNVLTVGKVAKLCGVSPRTVSKWFDSGMLSGYRIPTTGTGKGAGKGDRRIPEQELLKFMQRHELPIPEELVCE